MVSHWLQFETDEPFVPDLDKFGFVYLITNTKTRKKYVGCKQYYIGKAKTASKWETYMGSSKYLKDDIKKIGKKHFKFEAIAEYINKRSLRYYEAYYQMKWNVLASTIEGTDEPAFYNSYVGGKWYRPVESYCRGEDHWAFGKPLTEETRKKMSETKLGENNPTYKGKSEFYLEDKRMVVNCLSVWADKNGYNKKALYQIAYTNSDGFYKDNSVTKGIRKRFKHKGPLGIVTKVKWLGKEETNGD